jgi:Na+/proline symporter
VPEPHLEPIDWLLIGSWFATLLAIGLYYRRFAGRSLEHFFLAGRRNSGWANGLSYAGAMLNADVAPAYSGLAAVTGLFICWWYLSRFGIAFFLGAVLFAVFWRRLNLFTTPEFYELRFGGTASSVIRTWVALRSALVAMVAWSGTGLLAMHKIAQPVLGIDDLTTTLMIVLPIVLMSTALAGYAGVVATAAIHNLIMFVGCAMLCGIVLYQLGGPAELAAQFERVAGLDGLGALPPIHHEVFPLWAALAYMIGSSIGYGGDTAPMGGAMEGQCLQASRNAREASKMYIVAAVTLFVLLLLVTLPALGAAVQWPRLRLPLDDPKHIDREQAYGFLMAKYLPPGLLGLLFVVMLASVMGTVAGNLTFGSQLLVNDVYRRYVRPRASDRHYLWVGRAAGLFILCLALVVVYKVSLIFDVAVFMLQFSAAELPANWAQWWWWRFNSWGRLTASFGAPVILLLVRFVLLPKWAWWDQTYLVIAVNTGLWVLVTLLTRPDRSEVLDRFFRKGRPLGAWGPVRSRVASEVDDAAGKTSGAALIAVGLVLALVGAASVMCLVLALSHLYVGHTQAALVELAGFALGAGVFFWAYGPYLARLESRAPVEPDTKPTPSPGEPPTAESMEGLSPAEPAAPGTVVAVASGAYGLLLVLGGLIVTHGEGLVFNLLAGAALIASAVAVWWVGRT